MATEAVVAKTKGVRELEATGFKVVREVTPGKWFEVITPHEDEACMYRVGPHKWHTFFDCKATASGHDPLSALKGGLGDVISTDSQLRSYCNAIMDAPPSLRDKYDGLCEAQMQADYEMNP